MLAQAMPLSRRSAIFEARASRSSGSITDRRQPDVPGRRPPPRAAARPSRCGARRDPVVAGRRCRSRSSNPAVMKWTIRAPRRSSRALVPRVVARRIATGGSGAAEGVPVIRRAASSGASSPDRSSTGLPGSQRLWNGPANRTMPVDASCSWIVTPLVLAERRELDSRSEIHRAATSHRCKRSSSVLDRLHPIPQGAARQHLAAVELTLGIARDAIGECPPGVDPDLPRRHRPHCAGCPSASQKPRNSGRENRKKWRLPNAKNPKSEVRTRRRLLRRIRPHLKEEAMSRPQATVRRVGRRPTANPK